MGCNNERLKCVANKMLLWLVDGKAEVTVENFVCTCAKKYHCGASQLVAGRHTYGIFFLNTHFGVAFELLYDWLGDHVRNGTTLASRFDNIVKLQRTGGVTGPTPSSLPVWAASRHFITSTHTIWIECPICGRHPLILVVDATAIWVDVDSITGYFTTPDGAPPVQRNVGHALQFQGRKLISSSRARSKLSNKDTGYITKVGLPHGHLGPAPAPFDFDSWFQIFEGHDSVRQFMMHMRTLQAAPGIVYSYPGYHKLLKYLCSDFVSDTVIVPPYAWGIVELIVAAPDGTPHVISEVTRQQIDDRCPLLCKVSLRNLNWQIDGPIKAVLGSLLRLSKQSLEADTASGLSGAGNIKDYKEEISSFADGFQQHSNRPFFTDKEDDQGRSKTKKDDTKCRSEFHGFKGKGAKHTNKRIMGIMTFLCIHGFCYGFHIIKGGESPNDVFTVIITRTKGLKIIIYDNGCKIYEYFLNRMPGWLKKLIILIDTS
jgi:hypothetical protein